MIPMLLVAQMLIVHAPPPPPQAEAIRILRESPGLSNIVNWFPPFSTDGPRVVVINSSVTDGPFGAFPKLPPATRLDGTPLWLPPIVYGVPYPYTPFQWAILNGGRQ